MSLRDGARLLSSGRDRAGEVSREQAKATQKQIRIEVAGIDLQCLLILLHGLRHAIQRT